jgi:hypothetical protein
VEGSGHDLIRGITGHLPGRIENHEKSLSEQLGIPAEIRTERFPNTSQKQ